MDVVGVHGFVAAIGAVLRLRAIGPRIVLGMVTVTAAAAEIGCRVVAAMAIRSVEAAAGEAAA